MDKFYWYVFEDGYRVMTRGFSRIELQHEERRHGKLKERVEAE